MTDAGGLAADVEFFRQAGDGVAVEGGVEVHGALDDENDGDDGPFLPTAERGVGQSVAILEGRVPMYSPRVGETSLLRTVLVLQLDLVLEVGVRGGSVLLVCGSLSLFLVAETGGICRVRGQGLLRRHACLFIDVDRGRMLSR